MKKLCCIGLILTGLSLLSFSQRDNKQRSVIYRAWIRTVTGNELAGILYQTSDSAVIIADTQLEVDFLSGNYKTTELYYSNIAIIETRGNNSKGIGFLAGTITGCLIGALVGPSFEEKPDPHEEFDLVMADSFKRVIGGILGGLCGSVLGTAVGSIRITIPINGNIDSFNNSKGNLHRYSYIK